MSNLYCFILLIYLLDGILFNDQIISKNLEVLIQ